MIIADILLFLGGAKVRNDYGFWPMGFGQLLHHEIIDIEQVLAIYDV
jgi:hypothetical protein